MALFTPPVSAGALGISARARLRAVAAALTLPPAVTLAARFLTSVVMVDFSPPSMVLWITLVSLTRWIRSRAKATFVLSG